MKKFVWVCFNIIIGFGAGVIFMIYRCGYILEREKKKADKYYTYFDFLDRWIIKIEQNYDYAEYFHKHNIETAAIYGMGKIGKHLKHELENAGIKIAYVIDEGESIIYSNTARYNLRDDLPTVDLVIVTPIEEFEQIKHQILKNNRNLHVVSVNSIISGEEKA